MENIERDNTLNVYASVWELGDDGNMVLTKDGKIVLNKEPSWTLLKLIGKQLDVMVFALRNRWEHLDPLHKCTN